MTRLGPLAVLGCVRCFGRMLGPMDGTPGPGAPSDPPLPWIPDYGGGCIAGLSPALLALVEGVVEPASWLPTTLQGARQVVLLILDGLGWDQLRTRSAIAPYLSSAAARPITSVVPTTTATALTSIATGLTPAAHGILGYRIRVPGDAVLNVLRWRTGDGDAREALVPEEFQPTDTFGGRSVPVVSPARFGGTGFTRAYLRGATHVGSTVASSTRVEVRRLLAAGAPYVVAYYEGVDVVAHAHGFGEHYDAELAQVDRFVADIADDLPAGCALAVTADHGQVEVPGQPIVVDPELLEPVTMMSGEARFRWLHVRPGAAGDVAAGLAERYGDVAWVRTREEVEEAGWFGGPLRAELADRVGDVALLAHAPVAFADPAETGGTRLVCRHGSLTRAEMLVPLLAWAP